MAPKHRTRSRKLIDSDNEDELVQKPVPVTAQAKEAGPCDSSYDSEDDMPVPLTKAAAKTNHDNNTTSSPASTDGEEDYGGFDISDLESGSEEGEEQSSEFEPERETSATTEEGVEGEKTSVTGEVEREESGTAEEEEQSLGAEGEVETTATTEDENNDDMEEGDMTSNQAQVTGAAKQAKPKLQVVTDESGPSMRGSLRLAQSRAKSTIQDPCDSLTRRRKPSESVEDEKSHMSELASSDQADPRQNPKDPLKEHRERGSDIPLFEDAKQRVDDLVEESIGGSGLSEGARQMIAEFEKESAEGRKDSRLGNESAAEDNLAHKTTPPPLPEGPKLAEQIREAVDASQRRAFTKGDMAIVVDADDLKKAVLVPSGSVFKASAIVQQNAVAIGSKDAGLSGLGYLLLLEAGEGDASIPVLRSIHDVKAVKDLEQSDHKPFSRIPKPVKVEAEGEEREEEVAISRSDWIKAYENFFRMIDAANASNQESRSQTKRRQGRLNDDIFGSEAASALPQIESVIAVAKECDALQSIAPLLESLLLHYIGNQSLWKAIAADAASWLLIGLTLEEPATYREAFRHLAGRFPSWPWRGDASYIPKDIMKALESKSKDFELRLTRIENQLLKSTLKAKINRINELAPVSPSHKPLMYSVVTIWRDWICDHSSYIEDAGVNGTTEPRKSKFCHHSDGRCLTTAGFYRSIFKGGDEYLPADRVVEKWDEEDYLNLEKEDNTIRYALNKLKEKASEIVGPIVKSTLQYDGKDKLPYLTSIDIAENEVPWWKDDDDVEMEK